MRGAPFERERFRQRRRAQEAHCLHGEVGGAISTSDSNLPQKITTCATHPVFLFSHSCGALVMEARLKLALRGFRGRSRIRRATITRTEILALNTSKQIPACGVSGISACETDLAT